ncbi:MAG: DUF58 domain-containing protein [Gemmatimonadota bacterium]|nr:DUF58 domain-containing protein [Gemmatimonadota bacterium]
MITEEILQEVRRIEIMTRSLVNDVFSGEYHSIFKGLGMEFSEVREYQPGDDIRSIDWNVTARMGHPYVKKFVEERELTVVFLVDVSASMGFGTVARMKNELAARVCAVLAFSAIKNNDRVGLVTVTDQVEKVVVPRKGRKHVLRVIRELLAHDPCYKGTSLGRGLEYMLHVLNRKSVLFVVSDFLDTGYEQPMRIAARRHDVIPVRITDPRELELPRVGLMYLEDPETGRRAVVDTSAAGMSAFSGQAGLRHERQREFFSSAGIEPIDLRVDQSYIKPLMDFFRRRAKKFR